MFINFCILCKKNRKQKNCIYKIFEINNLNNFEITKKYCKSESGTERGRGRSERFKERKSVKYFAFDVKIFIKISNNNKRDLQKVLSATAWCSHRLTLFGR